jgi:hypothetical protein
MKRQLRIARLGALLFIQLATATTFSQERREDNHSFESSVAERERTVMREAARTSLWRIYRQQLYLNQDSLPFATVEWNHTLDGITLLNVTAGPPRSASPVESTSQSPAGNSRDPR